VDVAAVQEKLEAGGRRAYVDRAVDPAGALPANWTPEQIQREVENNAQGILGYVVRWIDQGVGCSKVPDINDVGLMEDRATCRISAQHIANWLHHGVVSRRRSWKAMKRWRRWSTSRTPAIRPTSRWRRASTAIAFQAACDLVLEGRKQPSATPSRCCMPAPPEPASGSGTDRNNDKARPGHPGGLLIFNKV
jgi:malate synthase